MLTTTVLLPWGVAYKLVSQRIVEIDEGLVRQFPSIAIFVPSEAQVQPVAQGAFPLSSASCTPRAPPWT